MKMTEVTEKKKTNPKTRVGVVVSNKMEKTAVVKVDSRSPHRVFKKIVTSSKRFYIHDEKNEVNIGDRVKIEETRPLSSLKRWRLKEIIEKSVG